MTTRKHDERYKKAKAKITLPRVSNALQKAMKELGLKKYVPNTHDGLKIEALVKEKLGLRQEEDINAFVRSFNEVKAIINPITEVTLRKTTNA